jgi:prepilin-type N-terminal cleavage/methylation domain-containing protein
MEVIMSIQKSLKKGFTLIELMVVIVIIGILAAIAIPKLFGMSAKAKAQEVGPSAGTWVKLQQAYKMETGHFGWSKNISYKLPGGGTSDIKKAQDSTSNFFYDVDSLKFEGKSRFKADDCAQGSIWTAELTEGATAPDEPEMSLSVATCKALTPNFYAIGKEKATAPGGGGGGGGGGTTP